MIKKIFTLLLSVAVLHNQGISQDKTDQRTAETRIADLLTQMPARDAKLLENNIRDINNLGVDGFVQLISELKGPGEGDNAELEYAISGYSAYVSQPGQGKEREMSVKAYSQALPQLKDNHSKQFIISQLELVGKDDAISALVPFLKDQALVDPATRALVRIHTNDANKALLDALTAGNNAEKMSLVEALGDARYAPAAARIAELASGHDPKLTKVALYALAKIGEPSSAETFFKAAEKNGYEYDVTNAVASSSLYAEQLVKNGHPKIAEKIADELYSHAKGVDQMGVKTTALKVLIDANPKSRSKYLLQAAGDNEELRAAALGFAGPTLNKKSTKLWMRQLSKASDAGKIDIIRMFGKYKTKAALPAVVQLLKRTSNEPVKLAAIKAAGEIGDAQVLDDLLALTSNADGQELKTISEVILRMKGKQVTEKAAAAIPKATPTAKVALLQMLAARAANGQLATVYQQLDSQEPGVSDAAYQALTQVVTKENLPQLFTLLEKAPAKHASQVQSAIIEALKGYENDRATTTAVLKEMKSAPASKQVLFYKILASMGGDESLSAVSGAFENGDANTQAAALDALAAWNDPSSAQTLIEIARSTNNDAYRKKAIDGYLSLISKHDFPAEEQVLMLRNAMAVTRSTDQKKNIIKAVSKAECFNALIFAGQYLDDANLQQDAAMSVMEVALAGDYYGRVVKNLLQKTKAKIQGPDSDYQKKAIDKYINEMRPGAGFVQLFNGKDLTGWKGLVADPVKRSKMDAKTLAAEQKKANEAMQDSWKVVDGELRFMSHGNNLATVKQYGDFEMLVDWKIIDDKKGQGDAGIYLRGTPQVQIWDTSRTKVGAQVGSGGLYNNQKHESKPLQVADNQLGEWNTFRIIMKGDRVTVYLNGILVTDSVVLENYWDRSQPIFPKEQIELQAHGSPVVYRDIYVREINGSKPFQLSSKEKNEGFKVLFDGSDLDNWTGNKTDYVVEEGNIAIRPKPGKGSGGNLYTKGEYSDFVFRFEFKLTPNANNGLGIRAPLEGDAAYQGMELQILDNDAPMYKKLHVYQYHGSIYGTIPAKRGFLKPVGEWNYEEVIAKGPKIKVILNGTVIMDGDITDARKNGAADGKSHPGLQRKSGHIGFLGHGSTVFFRNIRVKDLSDSKQ